MSTLAATDLDPAVNRAVSALLAGRNAHGFWEGRLASSPLATAVSVLALRDTPAFGTAQRERAFAYLARTQNGDGGWGDTARSRSNLAATLLAVCADAAGGGLSDTQRSAARAYVQAQGGAGEGLRRVYGSDLTFQVPLRMAAACAGLLPWSQVDALPFELACAPRGMLGALRLPVVSYAIPALVCVGLARHAQAPSWMLPARWLRAAATEKALALAASMQPQSGGFLEATPITAFCALGLAAAGRADHPIAERARAFLLATQREDGAWPVEVDLSVWNTTRAVDALAAAGVLNHVLSADERRTTRDWLLAQQTTGTHVYSDAQPGGWGWNHHPGSVPDADDTSGAILALRHLGVEESHPALVAGKRWLVNLQNRNGGWPTFCRGWEKLPFDRSAPDLTAHAVRALSAGRVPPQQQGVELNEAVGWTFARDRGLEYLQKNQTREGSFKPLWFGCEDSPDQLNHLYGTSHVLFALGESGPVATRALDWLRRAQNRDGSFGGNTGARGTAEETGLGLRALIAAGLRPNEQCCRFAAQWLLERQESGGNWAPSPVGFYFAVLWYYEELYPLCYALGGLGRLRAALV